MTFCALAHTSLINQPVGRKLEVYILFLFSFGVRSSETEKLGTNVLFVSVLVFNRAVD